MSVTNVTGLLLVCFVESYSLSIDVFCSSTNRYVKGNVKFVGGFFKQNHCHACHTNYVCHHLSSPIQLPKFTNADQNKIYPEVEIM